MLLQLHSKNYDINPSSVTITADIFQLIKYLLKSCTSFTFILFWKRQISCQIDCSSICKKTIARVETVIATRVQRFFLQCRVLESVLNGCQNVVSFFNISNKSCCSPRSRLYGHFTLHSHSKIYSSCLHWYEWIHLKSGPPMDLSPAQVMGLWTYTDV